MKMGNIVPRMGIEYISLGQCATITPCRHTDVTTIPLPICLCGSVPQRSRQTTTVSTCVYIYIVQYVFGCQVNTVLPIGVPRINHRRARVRAARDRPDTQVAGVWNGWSLVSPTTTPIPCECVNQERRILFRISLYLGCIQGMLRCRLRDISMTFTYVCLIVDSEMSHFSGRRRKRTVRCACALGSGKVHGIEVAGLFVVLCHINSISVISCCWYDVWDKKEKAWAYTFTNSRDH